MAKVLKNRLMEQLSKEITSKGKNRVTERLDGLMEASMQVISLITNCMVTALTFGMVKIHILGHG